MNWKIIITIYLGFAASTHAREHFEFYRGIRQMGMGGAAIGVVNDQTALLLNPAGLGRLRDFYLTLADPTAELTMKDEKIAGGFAKLPDMLDPQTALDQSNANRGDRFHMSGSVFPSIVFPNFGIGFLGRLSEDAQVDTAGTAFAFNYTSDYAIVTGMNFSFLDGIVKVGGNARLINRGEVDRDDLSPTATDLSMNTLLTEGMGLGSDVGLILTAPIVWLPSLSAVVRDVGGTAYTLRKGLLHPNTANAPNRTPQTLHAAFSVSPIIDNDLRAQITFEMRDVLNVYEDDLAVRRMHGGFELNWADALFLRAGYNEGYWTAGFEIAVFNYQIQGASYGEEVGTSSARQEDRRYMGSFAIRF